MSCIYFPIATLFISLLIGIVFLCKPNARNQETTIYRLLLIINFIQAVYDIIVIILAFLYIYVII